MGWSKYIVIPAWKVMIEVPKEVDDDTGNRYQDSLDKLESIFEDVDVCVFDKKLTEISLHDMASIVKIAEHSTIIGTEGDMHGTAPYLMMFLKSRKIQYDIIDETILDKPEVEKKYKDYVRVRR